MRVTVPVTGEMIGREWDGSPSGNPDDPIRPIDIVRLLVDSGYPIECADFSLTLAGINADTGLAELEIAHQKKLIPTAWNAEGEAVASRDETDADFEKRKGDSEEALLDVLGRPVDEIYQKTGEPRLKKPKEKK